VPENSTQAPGGAAEQEAVRLTATVHGYVQGVGFRWSTMSCARTLDLRGVAENLMNGDVLVVAEGPRHRCQQLLDWLQGRGTRVVRRPGRVESVDVRWGPAEGGFRSFTAR
jgi:acylphosphatase